MLIWLPTIYLTIISLVVLILIAISYFSNAKIDLHKQKYFSTHLVSTSIAMLIWITILYVWFSYNLSVNVTVFSGEYVSVSFYNFVWIIIVILTAVFILSNSIPYIINHIRSCTEFAFLMVLNVLFLVLLLNSNELLLMFICIIGFSLNMYVLILYDAPSILSLEAGAKYFYLSALSSGLLSSGLLLTYIWLLGTKFWYITYVIYGLTNINVGLGIGIIALASIIYGFLFKLAAFPCHLWAPEIYAGSPNVTMGFFVLPIKIATLAVFIKLLTCVFKDAYVGWSYILWFSSALSMIWGCLGAYLEDKIKKFIAYSSINQMGFLLIGITCGGFEGIRATIIYLLIYILMNIGFLQLYLGTWNTQTNRNIEYLPELKYFSKQNWIYSIGLAIILFSMAGIPPLAGFFGKYFLFLVAFQSEYYLLIFVGMLTSLVSAFYYLRIIKIMWFENTLYNFWGITILKTHLTFTQRQVFFVSEILIICFILWSKFLFNLSTTMTSACQFM